MRCEYCPNEATHTGCIVDASVPGITPSEAGYRRVPLCLAHALERRRSSGSQVEPLPEDITGFSSEIAAWG